MKDFRRFLICLGFLCAVFFATMSLILSYYSHEHNASEQKYSPQFKSVQMSRAVRMIREEKYYESEAILRQILAIEPEDEQALQMLGNVLLLMRRNYEAWNVLRRAVTVSPDSAVAHNNLGMVLLRLKIYPGAIASLERAMALDDSIPYIEQSLSQACRLNGDNRKADYYAMRQELREREIQRMEAAGEAIPVGRTEEFFEFPSEEETAESEETGE